MWGNVNYLSSLKDHLRLDPAVQDTLIRELRGHLEDKIRDLKESGMSEGEAREVAVKILGSPRIIAQQIYEVYSQGSWRQTFFAALPHVLIASLFALRWWSNIIWLSAILLAVIATVIYGWSHGKPTWLFSWMSYLLIPVVAAGTLLLYLPGGWVWVAILFYAPSAIFVLFLVNRQILRRDWLFVSLMLLPAPTVLGWIIVLSTGGDFWGIEQVYKAASWIALSFAVLALAAATFVRVRQRWLKAGALVTSSIMILAVVTLVSNNALNFWGWLGLSVLALLHLVGPALLERGVRKSPTADS